MCYSECYLEQPIYCDRACFAQKSTVHRFAGEVLAVDQNVTVVNPIKVDSHFYDCTIKGDGEVQHFGPVYKVFPYLPIPRLEMVCTRSAASQQ
jgi:hypothetical protein